MTHTPLVSVRIPSYNHEKYIRACIQSILDQTFTDFEIVIVDDCSTDHSVEVIQSFDDPRIKLEVLPRNSGMNVAVARCVQLSSGKYIANLSSDDLWAPTKLAEQVAYLEHNPDCAAVFTQVTIVGEDGQELTPQEFLSPFDYENRSPDEWLRRFFYLGNCLCSPSVMIRREVYEKFSCQDKRMVSLSDFDLWVKLSLEYKLWVLDQKLTMFRVRAGGANLSANNPGNQRRQMFEFKQILDHYLEIHDPERLKYIFPECEKFGEPEARTIPYFLGRLAIDVPTMVHWLWGCEKIFDLMADPDMARLLEEKYDFRYRDFIDLTKTAPPAPPEPATQPKPAPKPNLAAYGVYRVKRILARLFPRGYLALKRRFYRVFGKSE